MPKDRITADEAVEKELIFDSPNSRAAFEELMGDSKPLPSKYAKGLREEDIVHVGETINPVNVTNIGYRNKGGIATVYIALQNIFTYVASKTGISEKQLREECSKLGPVEFSRKHSSGLLNRVNASKYLFVELKNNEQDGKAFTERFLREAEIIRRIKHPRVPTPIHSDSNVIVSTYFPHTKPLSELIGNDFRTLWEKAKMVEHTVRIFSDISDQCKSEGRGIILHRDISTGNVLWNPFSLETFAIDFGQGVKDEGDPTVTNTGVIIGTLSYISPEVAANGMKGVYDMRSEIYCIGATAFHLLTDETVYRNKEGTLQSALEIITGEPRKALETNPNLPERLAWVLDKAVEKDPDDRFQTITELYEELRDAISPLPCQRSEVGEDAKRKILVYRSESSIIVDKPSKKELELGDKAKRAERVRRCKEIGDPTIIIPARETPESEADKPYTLDENAETIIAPLETPSKAIGKEAHPDDEKSDWLDEGSEEKWNNWLDESSENEGENTIRKSELKHQIPESPSPRLPDYQPKYSRFSISCKPYQSERGISYRITTRKKL